MMMAKSKMTIEYVMDKKWVYHMLEISPHKLAGQSDQSDQVEQGEQGEQGVTNVRCG